MASPPAGPGSPPAAVPLSPFAGAVPPPGSPPAAGPVPAFAGPVPPPGSPPAGPVHRLFSCCSRSKKPGSAPPPGSPQAGVPPCSPKPAPPGYVDAEAERVLAKYRTSSYSWNTYNPAILGGGAGVAPEYTTPLNAEADTLLKKYRSGYTPQRPSQMGSPRLYQLPTFDQMDLNGDGSISRAEFNARFLRSSPY